MRMPTLALAGLFAGAALFASCSSNSGPAATGFAGEHRAVRTFGGRDHFHGPSSFSGAGVFFRSDGTEIHLGTRGLLRERRFGFDHRWDHGVRDRGFDRHRFTGPRIWDHRFGKDPRFGDRRFGDDRFGIDRFGDHRLRDRRLRDRDFGHHRFTGPRVWDRRFMEDSRFKFRSRPDSLRRDWDRRHFHGPTHGPFGNRSGRFGTRSR